ncbi:MAG: hypothetical protein AAFV85_11270 [Cyanobacteria bacterium J06634_6]
MLEAALPYKNTIVAVGLWPLSNVELNVFDSMSDHTLKQLLDLGLCATVINRMPFEFSGEQRRKTST